MFKAYRLYGGHAYVRIYIYTCRSDLIKRARATKKVRGELKWRRCISVLRDCRRDFDKGVVVLRQEGKKGKSRREKYPQIRLS